MNFKVYLGKDKNVTILADPTAFCIGRKIISVCYMCLCLIYRQTETHKAELKLKLLLKNSEVLHTRYW